MVSQQPSGNADGSNHLDNDDKKLVCFIGFNTVQTIDASCWYITKTEWDKKYFQHADVKLC